MTLTRNVNVYVRLRPLGKNELQSNLLLDDYENELTHKQSNKKYCFDKIFSADSSQEEIYQVVARPLISELLNGFNCTVFAYGQTGTGKTYTIEGIIPRAISHIFEGLTNKSEQYVIKASFLELYNEDAYDLLSDIEDTSKLRIYEDGQRTLKIEGLTEMTIEPGPSIVEVLSRGSHKRQTAATQLNAVSSRSHSIFRISILGREFEDQDFGRIGKINFVDLAGSENIARSGAQNKNAREAGSINQSLLTLNRVITALVENRPHVPYRESKLTRILQDSLGGSTRTSMIATVSPAEADITNTLSTLDYASRARSIKNHLEHSNSASNQLKKCDFERELTLLKEKHSEEMTRLEFKIRNEVAMDFRREVEKKDVQQKTEMENLKFAHREQLEDIQTKFQEQLEGIQTKLNEQLEKSSRLQQKLDANMSLLYEERLKKSIEIQELTNKIQSLERELEERDLKEQQPKTPPPSKENHLIERSYIDNDYLNTTFGDDEIVHVSAKKSSKKTLAAKKRELKERIEMSGKKIKLHANEMELSVSPPPVRVTRSRATRRKLDY